MSNVTAMYKFAKQTGVDVLVVSRPTHNSDISFIGNDLIIINRLFKHNSRISFRFAHELGHIMTSVQMNGLRTIGLLVF